MSYPFTSWAHIVYLSFLEHLSFWVAPPALQHCRGGFQWRVGSESDTNQTVWFLTHLIALLGLTKAQISVSERVYKLLRELIVNVGIDMGGNKWKMIILPSTLLFTALLLLSLASSLQVSWRPDNPCLVQSCKMSNLLDGDKLKFLPPLKVRLFWPLYTQIYTRHPWHFATPAWSATLFTFELATWLL